MMERTIPNLEKSICSPLFGLKQKRTPENYLKEIQKFERKCEESLIQTLSRIGTQAMVKTEPYSLPYTDEVVVQLYGESYMNGPYEFYRAARAFVQEVLKKGLWKVRFYILIDIMTERGPEGPQLFFMGKITYKFRYYNK